MFRHLISKPGKIGLGCSLLAAASVTFGAEYIVKFKSEKELNYSLYRAKSLFGATARGSHGKGRIAKIVLQSKDSQDEANQLVRLMNRPDVEYVVENFELHALGDYDAIQDANEGDEPRKQWALDKINAADAWASVSGKRDILVAVIDTGVDISHEDLASRIWTNADEIAGNGIDDDGNGYIDDIHGWDFFSNDNDPDDITSARNKGHGTHCAGIIGAIDNDKGISGIAHNVRIMPLRFLGPGGSGDLMNAIKAIDYAIAMKADVISASWGAGVSESRAKPLVEAIQRAEKAGILFVAAAANNGRSNDATSMFPANARTSNMISVAASDSSDQKPRWSNYGEGRVHLAAPGENILSTLPGDKYAALSGTSMATPLVAGLAAMLLAETEDNSDLTPPEIRSIMQSSGTKVQIETACNCRIDAKSSLERLSAKKMTVVPHTATIGIKKQEKFSTWGETSGKVSFKVTDPKVAKIDANGVLVGLRKGRTQVVATDATGQIAQSMDIRVGLSGAPKLCPMHPVTCFFVCIVSWKQPWCIWNRGKIEDTTFDPSLLTAEDLVEYR